MPPHEGTGRDTTPTSSYSKSEREVGYRRQGTDSRPRDTITFLLLWGVEASEARRRG